MSSWGSVKLQTICGFLNEVASHVIIIIIINTEIYPVYSLV